MVSNKKFPYYNQSVDENYQILKKVHNDFIEGLDNNLNNSWNFRTELTKSKLGTEYHIENQQEEENSNLKVKISGKN